MQQMKTSAFVVALASAPTLAQGSPVEKVVNLLKKLNGRIAQDGENEQKVYDKYACWCDTSMKLKADAIDQARKDIRSLQQEILTLKGEIATLGSEIDEHTAAIAENEKLQSDATVQRQKENGEYSAASDEMKQTLAALEDAINVLIKGQGGSLLQQSSGEAARATVRKVLAVLPSTAHVSDEQVSMLQDFMDASSRGKYAPQSMTIIGMLKNLYDSTSTDLEVTTSTEAAQNREYELFIKEKLTEKASLEDARTLRQGKKAEAEENLSAANSLYDETDAQMAADTNVFDTTKEGCIEKSAEWNIRKVLRANEMQGISKAMEILTSDAARELFAGTIKPGKSALPQVRSAPMSLLQVDDVAGAPAARAYAVLKKQATKAHSAALAQIAVQVRSAKAGHFEAVIQAIDNMVVALKEEGQADIDKRDQCKQEYLNTDSTVKQLTWEIEKNQAKIDKLASIIASHEEEKAETIQAISDTNAQIAQMTAQREAENLAFLSSKAEDEQAIGILDSAKDVLTQYYKDNGIEMVQLHQGPAFERDQFDAPDASLTGGASRAGETKGIVSLMDYIIEDLHGEVKQSIKDEETAQLNYEAAKKAAEQLVADLTAKKVSLEEAIAEKMERKAAEQGVQQDNQALLNDETSYRAQITTDCDWVIGAFTKRAQRRTAEVSGLTTAKEFLEGATLVQTKLRGGATR